MAFDDEEVDQEEAQDIATGEDVAVAEIDGACDEGREECEKEVPQPVGCRGQSHAFRSVARWIQLSADCPNHWSPRCGETEDEECCHDDHCCTA